MKKAEKVNKIYDIQVIKEKVETTGHCDCCENITRFSDRDDMILHIEFILK